MPAAAKHILLLTLIAAAIPAVATGQEMNCSVTIDDRQVSGSGHDHLQDLGPELTRYIKENRWTDDFYEPHERIHCQMQVVLTGSNSQYDYSSEVIISLRRPIYNAVQETATILLRDASWHFNYMPGRSILRDNLQFDDLASFVDFYVYVMLGYDYDSFSELGGTRWFQEALDIVELAQTSQTAGWGRISGAQRNRYGLITDLTSFTYEEVRRAVWIYHYQGLDRLTEEPQEAYISIVDAIRLIRENRQRVNRTWLFDLFFETKYNELVSVFQGASDVRRMEAYYLLTEADPGHTGTYEVLRY
ncbi:MAG: DUF4835 family protein [Balneolaceae bacterium]